MKEKLELVTDFATLRAGMIVRLYEYPGGTGTYHRAMLISKGDGEVVWESGANETTEHWNFAPAEGDDWDTLTRGDVRGGYVYLVVDGLEQTSESRKSVTV